MDTLLPTGEKDTYTELTRPDTIEEVQLKRNPAEAVDSDRMAMFQAELQRGYREFDIRGRKGRIHFPTVGDEEEIANAYSQAYNIIVGNKAMKTIAELEEIYNERGLWTEETDKELEKLEEDIEDFKMQITDLSLDEKLSDEDKAKEASRLFEAQKKKVLALSRLQTKKLDLFGTSIESRARESSIKAKMVCCVKSEDGERIWPTLEALSEETDRIFYDLVMKKAMLFWGGLPEDFLGELPVAQLGDLEL